MLLYHPLKRGFYFQIFVVVIFVIQFVHIAILIFVIPQVGWVWKNTYHRNGLIALSWNNLRYRQSPLYIPNLQLSEGRSWLQFHFSLHHGPVKKLNKSFEHDTLHMYIIYKSTTINYSNHLACIQLQYNLDYLNHVGDKQLFQTIKLRSSDKSRNLCY